MDISLPNIADKAAFIRDNTRLRPVPLIPDISIFVADEAVPLWHKTEEEIGRDGLPPPFWAFAWAGGQALGRYVLDHPDVVGGKHVLDLASGSGLVGIAAMKAGAASVAVADIDPFARVAADLNAQHNGITLTIVARDLLASPGDEQWDVILAGDIFYERDTAQRAFDFLTRQALRGTSVLIGDPGRSYLPKDKLVAVATYGVPVTRDLEDADIKHTSVWSLAVR
ncbi:nicotinamide N-methyase [Afipia sp. Root123D2]|uniref:class I SAM-dependent methyltransferase n=1 Tax=Afipia sp. Root123D2 TaxID=1736436 RepID=UPI0006FE2E7B|nr:methyltransferase [Afipia sp. Root123D2]KQW19475.1 nicotinamide N-methyase [Afipia sp. Root123D2]